MMTLNLMIVLNLTTDLMRTMARAVMRKLSKRTKKTQARKVTVARTTTTEPATKKKKKEKQQKGIIDYINS